MIATELLRLKPAPALRKQVACVVVLGAGDVGSAVAHVLFRQGYAVLLVEEEQPTSPRRGMCWVDAVFDGIAVLDHLSAVRVFYPADAAVAFASCIWLPLVVAPDLPLWLRQLGAQILVDARLRKHAAAQPDLRAMCGGATTAVGIGPGYTVGYNADVVIESAWGDELGRVRHVGSARPLAGEPRPILGAGRERLVYAQQDGVFETSLQIAQSVEAGEVIGHVHTPEGENLPLPAPLRGVLRGLTRSGVQVRRKTKLVEVDPRGDPALCFGLGERPLRIAHGVLHAVEHVVGAPTAQPHAA